MSEHNRDPIVRLLASTGMRRGECIGLRVEDVDFDHEVALVLGNETDGLSPAVRALCDGLLAIPMEGGVESLNVASAGAVAAFELRRRRRR